jgi:hypothetical protein
VGMPCSTADTAAWSGGGWEICMGVTGEGVGASPWEAVEGFPAKSPGSEELRMAGRLVLFRGGGATLLSTATGTGRDGGACRLCTLLNCPRGEIVLMAGAGVGREAGKEAGPDAGRVSGGRGGLARAGAAVLTASACPDNDGAQS